MLLRCPLAAASVLQPPRIPPVNYAHNPCNEIPNDMGETLTLRGLTSHRSSIGKSKGDEEQEARKEERMKKKRHSITVVEGDIIMIAIPDQCTHKPALSFKAMHIYKGLHIYKQAPQTRLTGFNASGFP